MKNPINTPGDNGPESGSDHASQELPLEIDTRDLLGARREATLVHAGERYRLRVTSNNKLILTK